MHYLRRLPSVFYIGLFPVVCMLWLWADSRFNTSSWDFCWSANRRHHVIVFPSQIQVTRIVGIPWENPAPDRPDLPPFTPMPVSFPGSFSRSPSPRNFVTMTLFPTFHKDFRYWLTDSFRVEWHQWGVPFWLILLAWLPPWLGLSWWQARRRRRSMKFES